MAVDLYAVEDGKLASTDSYWKNVDRWGQEIQDGLGRGGKRLRSQVQPNFAC